MTGAGQGRKPKLYPAEVDNEIRQVVATLTEQLRTCRFTHALLRHLFGRSRFRPTGAFKEEDSRVSYEAFASSRAHEKSRT